jgi:hypothetical protein
MAKSPLKAIKWINMGFQQRNAGFTNHSLKLCEWDSFRSNSPAFHKASALDDR